jgi:hypothetical protein
MTPRPLSRTLLPLFALAALIGTATHASAQVDPLLALKRLPPNVIIVMDTSFPMLSDGNGNFYDPKTYTRTDDTFAANALGVTAAQYRRIYQGLLFEPTQTPSSKYYATDIAVVQSTASNYARFWEPTRLETAKAGLAQALQENSAIVRWGLLKLRQNNEAWRVSPNCDKPVRITGNATLALAGDMSPCFVGGGLGELGKFGIYAPSTSGPNFGVTSGPADSVVYAVGSSNASTNILSQLNQTMGSGVLIPAGQDSATYVDRPLTYALTDAKYHILNTAAITADTCRDCRNTVVVLVTGGKNGGDSSYLSGNNVTTKAAEFVSMTINGAAHRVPIVVIGVKPDTADEAELSAIAGASGGKYFKATTVAEVTSAVNYAVQLGFAKAADVNAGNLSEYTFVSPVVGTVNLVNASNSSGSLLPDTDINSLAGPTTGQHLTQRSNFMLTAGFSLPGFDGRLRAFRVFKPVPDSSKNTGWKFVKDGTKLWPDLDDRPELAGIARTPFSSDARNIYTFIPNGSGGGQMVAFTVANAGTLSAHLGGANPATLIPFIRAQPLGAVIGSTPAIMDAPSLDPPPDADYGFQDSAGTFAGTHKDRRSMIFFGANDGMIHAVDARTGYEVWAFIPYNLLPKLRTLMDGQSVERFEYFVDSSPKVAEVKIGGNWKTLLIIGQGYGGTFYQAFDVTEAGMGVAQDADGLSAVSAMLAKFDAPDENITFDWSFPKYDNFDTTINYTSGTLTDGFPGSQVKLYGDLKPTATNAEKRVGFTFSDPAVGTLTNDRSINAVITGSGYFPEVEDDLPGRGHSAPRAGHTFYLLDASNGQPIGNPSGSTCNGTGCYDVGDVNSNGRKNTLQADVTAAGDTGSPVVVKAYVGDSDGKYWRFTFNSSGAISRTELVDTGQPIYSSSALLFVGTTDRYLFFGTGSDLLANTTPGGGSTGSGEAFKLYGVKDGPTAGTVTLTYTLNPKVMSAPTYLPTNGERPTSAPTVAGDIVFFTTTTDEATAACTDASTRLYAFTYVGTAAYDTNASGSITSNESPIVATTAGRGTAPFIVDQHLFMSTTSMTGAGVTLFGDPEDFNNGVGQVGVRILSWREIR